MNVLQFFMGCVYPGRTESIESIDQQPDCRFQVTNIDERGNVVSRGELQLTDRDLIYFRPGKFPIRWSIGCIRRYGSTDNGLIFTFETGRKSPTGEAIYAFRISHGTDLVNRLKEKIESSCHEAQRSHFPTSSKEVPYSDINIDVTKSLNELAQAHAESRIKLKVLI